ncbi:MAG: hypothetical protein JWM53_6115, partial [bacterium]|nr:hypothetical protein [bacterium]
MRAILALGLALGLALAGCVRPGPSLDGGRDGEVVYLVHNQ